MVEKAFIFDQGVHGSLAFHIRTALPSLRATAFIVKLLPRRKQQLSLKCGRSDELNKDFN